MCGENLVPVCKRAKDFRESGEYVITMPDGAQYRIFRDIYQFSYPVWYDAADTEFGIGYTKVEAFMKIVERHNAAKAKS